MAVLPPDPVYCFKGDMGYIHSLCFSVKNYNYCSQLLAATEKGTVHFWDLETNRLQHKQQMGESIQAVHYYDDNIITQEKSGVVKLWSIRKSSYGIMASYESGGGYCKSVVLNDNLMVAQENGAVDVLDVNNLMKVTQLVPEREESLGRVMCLQEVEIDGRVFLLGGYETGDVILWDLNKSKPCGHAKLQEHITSITFDSNTRRGVCAGASSTLQLFTIDKSFDITLKCEVSITNEGCNVVKLRPDKRIFVTGGWDGRLRVFSWKTLRILVVLAEHKGAVTDVQFSPCTISYWNSKIMAASGADGTITLWNLYN